MLSSKLLKFLIPLLFTLAILLGITQRRHLPDFSFGQKQTITHFKEPSTDSLEGYYQKSQILSQSAGTQTSTVNFLATGDIMLSRNVAGTIQKAHDPLLPFSKMADILKSTSFNFANLESPLSGSDYFNPDGSLVFNAPPKFTQGLKDYNFQVLNLANNHAFDQGLPGIDYTTKFLDGLNIKHEGVGTTLDEAWKPAVVESNGIKICFIGASYASSNDGGKTKNNYVARIEDVKNLKLEIQNSKSLCDFVVATMHAGIEYTRTPDQAQKDFAYAAIDAGADIVIGAHPHWVQTIEKYKGKYIFYSLGNFIFDQEWSQDTKEGLALKIQISKDKVQNPAMAGAATLDDLQGGRQGATIRSIELIPVIIENYSTPRPATLDEIKKILQKIGEKETILH